MCVKVKLSKTTRVISGTVLAATDLYNHMVQVGTSLISVKDSGAGLTAEQLQQICKEGVQFNANELQAGQGSGLGLFISKGIVNQHAGKLLVASEGLGKGVTFTVVLPVYNAPQRVAGANAGLVSQEDNSRTGTRWHPPADTIPEAVNEDGESDTFRLSNKIKLDPLPKAPIPPQHVLVVDDSTFNRKMLARLMKGKNHICEQAEDGQDAVNKYAEMVSRGETPDTILMDFEMPVMNGPTATAKLREMGCSSLIVGVTGNVLPDEQEYFKSKGANHVLPKPLVMEDLENIMRTFPYPLPQQSAFPLQSLTPALSPADIPADHRAVGVGAVEEEDLKPSSLSRKPTSQWSSVKTSARSQIHPEDEMV